MEFIKKKKKKSCVPIELVCWNIEVLFVKGSDKNVWLENIKMSTQMRVEFHGIVLLIESKTFWSHLTVFYKSRDLQFLPTAD